MPDLTRATIEQDVAIRSFVETVSTVGLIPHPSLVLKKIGKQIEIFDIVKKQPSVGGALRRYRDGIRRLDWDVTQATTRGERADFFAGLVRTWDIRALITDAITAREYGYSVFERDWQVVDGKTVPVSIKMRPRKWFRFDDLGQLRLITQDNSEGYICEEKWPRKFVAIRHEASDLNPYGEGLLDELYWHSKLLTFNLEQWAGFVEDDGRTHWIGWVPTGADEAYKVKVEQALLKLRNGAAGVIEEGTRVEKVDNTGRSSSTEAFDVFRKALISDINVLVLGSDLATNSQGTGAYASTESGIKIEDSALDAGKSLAEELINRTLADIAELNALPGSDDEEIEFELLKPVDRKLQAEIDKTYSEATGKRPSEQLMAKRGYDAGDWEDKPTTATPAAPMAFESGYGKSFADLIDAATALKKK